MERSHPSVQAWKERHERRTLWDTPAIFCTLARAVTIPSHQLQRELSVRVLRGNTVNEVLVVVPTYEVIRTQTCNESPRSARSRSPTGSGYQPLELKVTKSR